jgi:hypothetical protein
MNEKKGEGKEWRNRRNDFACVAQSVHASQSNNRSQKIKTYFLASSQSIYENAKVVTWN